jgi:hypothetical protein
MTCLSDMPGSHPCAAAAAACKMVWHQRLCLYTAQVQHSVYMQHELLLLLLLSLC